MAKILQDPFNRKISYLRLSLTKRCNLACKYCLPSGYNAALPRDELTAKEIYNLVKTFTTLGIKKVRLTGGEPTLRKDFIDIVKSLRSIPEIEILALTTNAINLVNNAKIYCDNGIDSINISLDSLNKEAFKKLTGYKNLDKILDSIKTCLDLPFKKVKINVVLLKEIIYTDLPKFLDYVKKYFIDVRFIELMCTLDNIEFFNKQHLPAINIKEKLIKAGWKSMGQESFTDGPNVLLSHPEYKGRVGFITPYSSKFCESCNRVRVTSNGKLQLCLFGAEKFDLKPYLQSSFDIEFLQQKILQLLHYKPKEHSLDKGILGLDNSFSKIGG